MDVRDATAIRRQWDWLRFLYSRGGQHRRIAEALADRMESEGGHGGRSGRGTCRQCANLLRSVYPLSPSLHRKFGYDHMLEMREIEERLRANGVTGVALHFAAVAQYEKAHADDPTYRQRQQTTVQSQPDLLRRALEEIRDGHNDPRALARQVLGAG